jgi:hypothetical protein
MPQKDYRTYLLEYRDIRLGLYILNRAAYASVP